MFSHKLQEAWHSQDDVITFFRNLVKQFSVEINYISLTCNATRLRCSMFFRICLASIAFSRERVKKNFNSNLVKLLNSWYLYSANFIKINK